VYDPSGDDFEEWGGKGISLGLDEEYQYDEYQKHGLQKGSVIAIGTDGIWESMNPKGEMFGKARFMNIIRRYANGTAHEIVDAVYAEIHSFMQGLPLEDDITLVIVKFDASDPG